MTTTVQARQATMYPLFRYRDPEAALAWLGDAFGLETLEISRNEAGEAFHVELRLGGGVIMISPDAADRPVSGTQDVYVALDAVDAHYERARAAGAEIVRPIGEQPYGSREYAARDLEGNTWHFGTYRPAGFS
jgi:uncharacterized glyoxalase superfamily protein PhnB